MNRILLSFTLLSISLTLPAQQEVSQKQMEEVYTQVQTPYKYGLVLAPERNDYKIDCPTVFRHNEKWYMTYVIYNGQTGSDGRGYETWLAESDNLLNWKTKGRLLAFRNGTWDTNQRGGFPALTDMNWGGSYELQPYKNKYWMTYIGGANAGYEAAPLNIGLAWTKEENLCKAIEWKAADKPILSSQDKDAQWFESLTEYKSIVYWDKDETLGYPFVMFYNAGGRHPKTNLKGERIGIALSKDMKKWKRYAGNPVFGHETEGTITGDAHIQKFGDVYVMFYFSAFNPTRRYKAYNTFACSYDLVHWTDWQGEDLIAPSKDYDNLFAHKSYIIKYNDVVYHFYCAVDKYNQRGIAVATSKRLGKSAVRFPKPEVKGVRTVMELKDGWESQMQGKEEWKKVSIPHNWDDYYGYRQLTHGNLHGTALYRTTFTLPSNLSFGERSGVRLYFYGIGTYATITLNGKDYGRHPIGRTTFTLDVTDAVRPGASNHLTVKVDHPAMITDMPWVCGGCSSEWGFSEGSQPFGIYRPVTLEITDNIRIEPFGVHIWNNDRADSVFVDTEVKNYGSTAQTLEVVNKLNDADGRPVFRLADQVTLAPGELKVIRQSSPVQNPTLWDTENPYLYSLVSMVKRDSKTTDEVTTPFGIRTISWPVKRNDGDGRFLLNGKPVFINGVCEYEHLFGQSHAFTQEQIASRVKQIRNAGFNAFRDAHQPHNLEYQKYWDEDGILFWPQFSAHIWYDTPRFRENFKAMLRQWIKERRNSPSVIMWGLQNESRLPKAFAEECCNIIREMDPTARNMRVITTCNGGKGTDWNVVQNWSGTYGGDPTNYGRELTGKEQLLNGEYGAWRSIDLHTEPGEFQQKGVWSEERMCQLLEMKIRQAEQVKDSVCGQFQWVFNSHDNPGRRQPDEGYRAIDKVGPFNYKGLVTPWEEPLDAYYMYRSNYVSAAKDPMVYIVSHTWPNRFVTGRRKATIEIYSNCDSVVLYNDTIGYNHLGTRVNQGRGTHFVWKEADIRYNTLKATGYYKGKAVAEDIIELNGLERAPRKTAYNINADTIVKPAIGYTYIYRINCGGDDYIDTHGSIWMQDNDILSHSWAERFKDLNPYLASQRCTHDPIKGTNDETLFQTFRYGRHELKYELDVPNGTYRVELFFIEPWHGTGGSAKTDCEGMRIFDVAINGKTVIDDLDIWAEAGHDTAYKRTAYTRVENGKLVIDFPEVKAGQAVISAIAIATKDSTMKHYWENTWKDATIKTPVDSLPKDENTRAKMTYEAKVKGNNVEWNISTGLAQVYTLRFNYMNTSAHPATVRLQFIDKAGAVLKDDRITFPEAAGKWAQISTTTGTYINAGDYRVVLSIDHTLRLRFKELEVE